ncbi:DUF262 domain-containing protein [Desulfomonile tiedjei]|uniref:DUF262 domain-containing protein n=1 Tax=Desulfomonile tiedjei TaxID=2358 RepID=UPI001B7FB96A|nr:DUF262 domain-containing protein [Desulfomonile tiedjei]
MENDTTLKGFNRRKIELLPGERITFEDTGSKHQATDEELNKRYVKGDIRIVTETARYSLAGILSMLRETVRTDKKNEPELRYMLDPEYQRRHRWSVERKSRLIESFLMNVPVPPVFLYERDLARYEVMDGRQRLTALSEFYDDKFELKGLQYWTELHGRTYSTLPSKVRDGIDRRYISSIILLTETASNEEQAAQLKKMVFERLNSGGVALSNQETRNAVYDGPLNQLCLELSKNQEFRSMWRIPNKPLPESEDDDEFEDKTSNMGRSMYEKMEDVELVLRFFAYRQIHSFPGGLNRISALLDRFLIEGNRFGSEILLAYKDIFQNTISFIFQSIGRNAFCKMNREGKALGRPTKIVYDPLMYVCSHYSHGADRATLLKNKNVLLDEFGKMYKECGWLFAGRRTNVADTQQRNKEVEQVFTNTLEKLTT